MHSVSSNYLQALDGVPFPGRYILKIQFPAPANDTYYSDAPAPGSVAADPSILHVDISRDEGRTTARIRINDPDGFFLARFEAGELEGVASILYHATDDLVSSDWMPLVDGEIAPDTKVETGSNFVELSILAGPLDLRKSLGTIATRDLFSNILPTHENRMLPIVYGAAKKVLAVGAGAGTRSVLARPLTADDTNLWVADATGFPSGTIKLRVGDEIITGSFSGRKFVISTRETVVVSGSTSHYTGNIFSIRCTPSLSEDDEVYTGLYVHLTVNGQEQARRITSSIGGGSKLLRYYPAFSTTLGAAYTVPPGTNFTIKTVAKLQSAGSPVEYTPSTDSTYIVSDRACKSINAVYVKTGDDDGFTPLESVYWSSNINDSTSFGGLGFNVATVTLNLPPTWIPRMHAISDDIYVDVDGPDSAGTLIENPADIIEGILTQRIGVVAGDIDSTAFTAAAVGLAPILFSFVIDRQMDGWMLCRSLAMQAMSVLDFSGPKITLKQLPVALDGTPSLTIGTDETLASELPIRIHGGRPKPVSVLHASFGFGVYRNEFVRTDTSAVTRFGERVRRFDLFAIADESVAKSIADFWLNRYANANTEIELIGRPELTRLAPGDTVALEFDDQLQTGQRGEVIRVIHQPRDGIQPERCAVTVRLPIWDGCATACEASCETGCESGCEMFCETVCESGCEATCETVCQTAAEMGCYSACQLSCTTACQMQCQAGCELGDQVGCSGSCEAAYETGCGSSCVSSCETACIVFCETVCESSGESGCASVEETTCGNGCETGCESDCEAVIEDMLSVDPADATRVTDNTLIAVLSDMFVIQDINGKSVLCLKDGLFVSDGTNTGVLALKYDSASGKWGVDVAFYSA